MATTRAILSAFGEDRIGIVAAVSRVLADCGVSIEDLRQTSVSGVFSMTMLVTVDEAAASFDAVRRSLATVANDLGLQIDFQREDTFRASHDAM